jgi:hypothetical protein
MEIMSSLGTIETNCTSRQAKAIFGECGRTNCSRPTGCLDQIVSPFDSSGDCQAPRSFSSFDNREATKDEKRRPKGRDFGHPGDRSVCCAAGPGSARSDSCYASTTASRHCFVGWTLRFTALHAEWLGSRMPYRSKLFPREAGLPFGQARGRRGLVRRVRRRDKFRSRR